jgi:hypothetical protein
MLRNITFLLFLFIAIISGRYKNLYLKTCVLTLFFFFLKKKAADLDYIMALKEPVTDKTYKQVKDDVESAGGKVTYEFHAAFKAVLVSLPSERVSTLHAKPYVEFIEEDKSGNVSFLYHRLVTDAFNISSYRVIHTVSLNKNHCILHNFLV